MGKTYQAKLDDVLEVIGQAEAYAQLAEEASELAQAALKIHRLSGTNPPRKTAQECLSGLLEEVADIEVVLDMLGVTLEKRRVIDDIKVAKANRWRSLVVEDYKK